VAWYFLDTSALARRYLQHEPNAARVVAVCRPTSEHVLTIAQVTPAEIASALARTARSGVIEAAAARWHWRQFQRHLRGQYRISDLDAAVLIFRHTIRAYDAVQIATALHLRPLLGPTVDFRFMTADQTQSTVAGTEGLDVDYVP
jgi:predicted nucleic acid-binding protein